MIPSRDFFGVYCATFKYIDDTYGREALEKYWAEYVADQFLDHLERLVAAKGLKGMHEYWSHALAEEDAQFRLELSDDYFRIYLGECPALRWLRTHGRLIFDDYCAHCPALYSRIMARHGYRWEQEIDAEAGRCVVTVRAVTPGRALPEAKPRRESGHVKKAGRS